MNKCSSERGILMGNLNLFDLMAILIEKEIFDIELNEKDMFGVSSDWLLDEIFENKIVEANTFTEYMIYIKYIKNNLENELIVYLE